ncbi:hypothetical protein HMSSN036_11480 [Paenibacillus macerans]|nr:hypothetical protein HMSSN036_11480 [Paenibacillus macerans]
MGTFKYHERNSRLREPLMEREFYYEAAIQGGAMNLKNVFPYIHYCNSRSPNDPRKLRSLITRTLQHHELILVTGGKGRYIVDNRSHTVQEGMLCYIRPDVYIRSSSMPVSR